jgi:multisubunit Na+/H+ antiporter MnhC subunit
MQASWEKLGYTPETAAPIITSRFDYSFDPIALAITAIVVIAYFLIVVAFSKSEYREVIAERFGRKE